MCLEATPCGRRKPGEIIGLPYLSKATFLMRNRLCYVISVASLIIMNCRIDRHA